MRLVLVPMSVWPIDGIVLDVTPLVRQPRDVEKLALTTLLHETPSTIKLEAPTYGTSANGWPLRVQCVHLFAGTTEVERRVLATYQFVDWIGMAMVIARDLSAFEANEGELLAMLATGEPDFTGDRAASLWHVLSDRPQ